MGEANPVSQNRNQSLTSRALRLVFVRIALVLICAGFISYFLNHSTIEEGARSQLTLTTEQMLHFESLRFAEIRHLQQNFLAEFEAVYADPRKRQQLIGDFDRLFVRHADGSYTQRPGLFEGKALPDGRRFPGMSATYAPDISPDNDVKARFALSYLLSYKYGSSARQRVFNFYGVVPEKGFPIFQAADIAKVFTYSGPQALRLEEYEFYSRGFVSPANETIFTRMYWDYSNNAWMTTIATPGNVDKNGKHRILACVDVLLNELMARSANPSIPGASSTIFVADSDGTLIYHPRYADAIKESQGSASIKSLKIESDYPVLSAVAGLERGAVTLVDTSDAIVAVGKIPDTPWALSVSYPKALMQPAIFQNLAIVIAVGMLTLLIEIFIMRSILQRQVAVPLSHLLRATRLLAQPNVHSSSIDLPTESNDELGVLARDFAFMAARVRQAQETLKNEK